MIRKKYTPGLQLRNRSEGPVLEGYVVRYKDVFKAGKYSERIAPGAFKYDRRVALNVMHDRGRIIGVHPGNVDLQAREDGLHLTARIPDTTDGRDVVTNVEAGILSGFSSEFIPRKETRNGNSVVVKKADLYGVGVVADPAYPMSEASLRDIIRAIPDMHDYVTDDRVTDQMLDYLYF